MKALVTGATSGIGYHIVKELVKRNIKVFLVGRSESKLKEMANTYKTKYLVADLSIDSDVTKAYEFGKSNKVNIVINCAGFGYIGTFLDNKLDNDINMINVNVNAVHKLTYLFLKEFENIDNGYILNVGSIAGFLPGPYMATYYATKNYVVKLTMAIHEELKHSNNKTHVAVLCPGPVDTNFNNVAGGTFKVKAQTPEYVARYAIKKLFKKKLVIIPGLSIKLGLFFSRFVPNWLILKILSKAQVSKLNK